MIGEISHGILPRPVATHSAAATDQPTHWRRKKKKKKQKKKRKKRKNEEVDERAMIPMYERACTIVPCIIVIAARHIEDVEEEEE